MYVQGVTTRKVTAVMQQLCGLEVTSSQVSRAARTLDEELAAWRERPWQEIPYLLLDARYEKVRVGGVVVSCALLVAIGITLEGQRTVLGVSVSLSEAEVHWREFLASLQDRGLHGVQLIVSDDHSGLRAALQSRLPGVKWQRCQFHLAKNLIDHLPKSVSQEESSAELRGVFNAPNREEANRLLELMVRKYADVDAKLPTQVQPVNPPTKHFYRSKVALSSAVLQPVSQVTVSKSRNSAHGVSERMRSNSCCEITSSRFPQRGSSISAMGLSRI